MGRAPGAHPLHIRRSVEVIAVLRLIEPAALTGRFARLAAHCLAAVALVVTVTWIGSE